jgi:nucleotide-binding universal stress UspA family protein
MPEVNYRQVVLATDGSDDAAHAAEHAISLALHYQARLTALAVVDIYTLMNPQTAAFSAEVLERERTFLREAADGVAAQARQAGVADARGEVREGFPRTTLVAALGDLHADLAVVGSHGRNAIQRLLIGSTSEHLVRHAPCPVLVVRPMD